MAQVVINGKTFEVGKASPRQIAGIAKLLSSVNVEARRSIAKAGLDLQSGAIIWAVLGELDEDRIVELAALAIGSDKKFAAENFDLLWVSEALALMIEQTNLKQVWENFTRIFSLEAEQPNLSE